MILLSVFAFEAAFTSWLSAFSDSYDNAKADSAIHFTTQAGKELSRYIIKLLYKTHLLQDNKQYHIQYKLIAEETV